MNTGPLPRISVARAPPGTAWDTYVERHPAAKPYHLAGWSETVADLFRLEAHYLTACNPTGDIVGVLPLVRQRSRLFRDRLTSLPFFNYGGALADDEGTRVALMARSMELARELGVSRLELRDTIPPPTGWSYRSDKAALLLELPLGTEELRKSFGSKLRSQIKRAEREQLQVRVGGVDRVADFYVVFAEVMRDLGTPVYPRSFFERLAERLAAYCTVMTVSYDGRPVAGAFLVGYRDTLEVPWAGTISAMKSRATNMVLYSEALKLAVERGFRTFDFGRSTIDSGPYRFKRQWGAVPVPLRWSVWPPESAPAEAQETAGARFSAATRIWSRLPLSVASRLGPLISPSLPW